MLARVLEPEVMDSAEEARDYDAMDHAEVNRVFVADFLAVWDGHNPILDLGTGTAQIPVELCRRSPAEVVAVDLAQHMIALARTNVQKAGLADCVRLERIDAKRLPFAAGTFAAVISNSIVHHIPEPATVLTEMLRVLRRGGRVFVRDLVRPASESEVQRLVATYAGQSNAHQQAMFADSLRAALTITEVQTLIEALGQEPRDVRQTSDRHWTWSARTGPAPA
jgi:ubiquinone/menaquinone biosynthesis C-methylase UbiE